MTVPVIRFGRIKKDTKCRVSYHIDTNYASFNEKHRHSMNKKTKTVPVMVPRHQGPTRSHVNIVKKSITLQMNQNFYTGPIDICPQSIC